MIETFSILGILGGILSSIADCFLDIKGVGNQKLGKYVESNWEKMAPKRFLWSTILCMFAVPMITCGFLALMMVLYNTHQTLAFVLGSIFLFGAMGCIMIHTCICLAPRIYQIIIKKSDIDLVNEVLDAVMKQISLPFFTQYIASVIIPAIAVMILIFQGILPLPLWCVLLNPVIFQIIGLLLRATKCKLFIDAPSIFAASLGLGMYGVLALMLV